MAIQIVNYQKQNKESALDKVLKGVQVAQGLIGSAINVNDLVEKRTSGALDQQRLEEQRKQFTTGQEMEQAKLDENRRQFDITSKQNDRKITADLASPSKRLEKLSIPDSITVKILAQGSADRKAIVEDLNAALVTLNDPNISESQKIIAGKNLGKTLNSAQGRDAVGEGEAKRLLGLLEFQFLNPLDEDTRLGRNLPGFIKQVGLKTKEIENAANGMDEKVNKILGSSPAARSPDSSGSKNSLDGVSEDEIRKELERRAKKAK